MAVDGLNALLLVDKEQVRPLSWTYSGALENGDVSCVSTTDADSMFSMHNTAQHKLQTY